MTVALNIGFDAQKAFLNTAGPGNYSRNTINALCSCYPGNGYFLFTPKKNTGLYAAPSSTAVISPENIWWNSVKPLWRTYKITELAVKSGLHIYHGLSHELPVGLEKTRIKSLVTIHDLIFIRFPRFYRAADRRTLFRRYKHACQTAGQIISVSHQTKRDIIEYLHVSEEKIEVLYQSVNPLFFQKNLPEELDLTRRRYNLPDKFILAPGAIEARKNLGATLEALQTGNIDMPLVVSGKPTKYLNAIRSQIQSLGKQLIFLHQVTDQELSHLYQMAELTVFPSVFEGFGLPVAEAQASGCPVITSNISSMPEAGGDAAYYIDPNDPEEIAEGIKQILKNPSLKEELSVNGRINAERFRPEKYAKSLMNLYLHLHHA